MILLYYPHIVLSFNTRAIFFIKFYARFYNDHYSAEVTALLKILFWLKKCF
jgi:hypothetical protein